MAVDDLPDGYVIQSQPDPSELPEGYVLDNNNAPSNLHTLGMLGGDLLRSPISAAAGIVDSTDRIPTWAYNTLRPSDTPPIDYPPSINQAIQSKLDNYLPTPQNTGEAILSSGARNAMFGPAGMVGGMTAGAIYNQPYGQENMSVGGRDIGVSPADVGATIVGMTSQGALSPKPLIMGDAVNSEAGRLGQINAANGIPMFPTDIAQPSLTSDLLQFFNSTPLSGKEGRGAEQQAALNSAAIKPMGESGSELSPVIMQQASKRIGQVYQDFGKQYDVSPQGGSTMLNSLGQQELSWEKLPESAQKQLQAYMKQDIMPAMNNNYSMPGDKWFKLQSNIGRDARAASDPQISSALFQMQDAVRTGMRQSIAPSDWDKFDTVNSQYRAMIALEGATKSGLGTGNVSPQSLITGVSKVYPNTVYNDPKALPQLAQGAQVLKQAQKNADRFTSSEIKTPFSGGRLLAYAATPFGAIFNRAMNTQITPMDWTNPYSAAFGRAVQGAAIPFSIAPPIQGNQ